MDNKFEIDVTLIDRLPWFDENPDEELTIFEGVTLTKRQLKELIREVVTRDKDLLEMMKYV